MSVRIRSSYPGPTVIVNQAPIVYDVTWSYETVVK